MDDNVKPWMEVCAWVLGGVAAFLTLLWLLGCVFAVYQLKQIGSIECGGLLLGLAVLTGPGTLATAVLSWLLVGFRRSPLPWISVLLWASPFLLALLASALTSILPAGMATHDRTVLPTAERGVEPDAPPNTHSPSAQGVGGR